MRSPFASERSGLPLMLIAAVALLIELAVLLAFGPTLERVLASWGSGRPDREESTTESDPPALDGESAADADEQPSGEDRRAASTTDAGSDETKTEEPIAEEPAQTSPDTADALAPSRDVGGEPLLAESQTHSVRWGDNLYDLAVRYWHDGRLWPFAYYANRELLVDPDRLRGGMTLSIPDLSADPVSFARSRTDLSAQAHLSAYRAYRTVGQLYRAQAVGSAPLAALGRFKQEKARWVLYAASWFVPGFPEGYTQAIDPEDLEILLSYQRRFGPPFANR